MPEDSPKGDVSLNVVVGGRRKQERLNAIQKVIREGNYCEPTIPMKLPSHKVDGPDGHWERAIGKKFWVVTGETIEDAIKRQRKSLYEINNDLRKLIKWREERKAEGIEDDYQAEVQRALGQDEFRDADGKLLKSSEVTPSMRLKKFVEDRTGILYQAALDLATGIFVERKDGKGHRRIYQERPDTSMIRYLLDHYHGKPTKKDEETDTNADTEKDKPSINDRYTVGGIES